MSRRISVGVRLDGNARGFQEASRQAQRSTQRLQNTSRTAATSIQRSFARIGVAMAAAVAIRGIQRLINSTMELADRVSDLADITDMTTDAIQEYQYVARIAGVNTEAVTRAAEGLTRRLQNIDRESSAVTRGLERLGVRVRDVHGEFRTGGDIIDETITALAKMESAVERNALGAQIFGGSWSEIAPILALGIEQIDELRQRAHELGAVMSEEDIESWDDFRQAMVDLQIAFTGIARELATTILPVLEKVVKAISDLLETAMDPDAKPRRELIAGIRERVDAFKSVVEQELEGIEDPVVRIRILLEAKEVMLEVLKEKAARSAEKEEIARVSQHTHDFLNQWRRGTITSPQGLLERQFPRLISNVFWDFAGLALLLEKQFPGQFPRLNEFVEDWAGALTEEILPPMHVEAAEVEHLYSGLFSWIEEQIGAERAKIEAEIAKLEEATKEIPILKNLREQLAELRDAREEATDPKEIQHYNEKINAVRSMISFIEEYTGATWDLARAQEHIETILDQANDRLRDTDDILDSLVPNFRELGDASRDAGDKIAYNIFGQLYTFNEEVAAGTKAVHELQSSFRALFAATGEGFEGMADAFINAIKRMVAEAMAAMAVFFLLNVLTGGTGRLAKWAAQVLGDKSLGQFMGYTPMEEGGIVNKPTFAQLAEYPGAHHNPEVVMKLSKLKSMMGAQRIHITVDGRVQGKELALVLNRYAQSEKLST